MEGDLVGDVGVELDIQQVSDGSFVLDVPALGEAASELFVEGVVPVVRVGNAEIIDVYADDNVLNDPLDFFSFAEHARV